MNQFLDGFLLPATLAWKGLRAAGRAVAAAYRVYMAAVENVNSAALRNMIHTTVFMGIGQALVTAALYL